MTPQQAQRVLLAWRSNRSADADPEVQEALRLARQDPALRDWFERHQSFQASATAALRSIQPPADLASRLLVSRKTVRPDFNSRLLAVALAAAAAITAMVLWAGYFRAPTEATDFANFTQRMVKAAVREYRMDVVTNDLAVIRQFLGGRQAPADFTFPPALAALRPVGCGALAWRGHPISMVCLDNANLGMMYLFIAPADAFSAGAPVVPALGQVSRLATASWVQGDRAYLLAASAMPDQLRPFLPPPNPRAAKAPRNRENLQLVLGDDSFPNGHCRPVH
jgi:hypothetical protein